MPAAESCSSSQAVANARHDAEDHSSMPASMSAVSGLLSLPFATVVIHALTAFTFSEGHAGSRFLALVCHSWFHLLVANLHISQD
jgi:hypothetical protein